MVNKASTHRACALVITLAMLGCSTSSETLDGGADVPSHDAGQGYTCGQLLHCDQTCMDSACTDQCYRDATAVAQGLFDEFNACIATNCSSAPGGPCADASSTECQSCGQMVATGACISRLLPCTQDMMHGPPNPDGGGVMGMDAGPQTNCGALLTCHAACADGDTACGAACEATATPTALTLEMALNDCLAMACPSTPGGPCEMPGLDCMGCIEQVTLAEPNTCAAPYVACNMDTSAGGAATPMALVDGGVLSTVLTGLRQPASTIVASNGYLYYTQVVGDEPVSRFALDTDGGVTEAGVAVSTLGPNQRTPVSLAVDDHNVYVWSVGTFELGSSFNNMDGTVVQVPLDGSPAIMLGDGIEVFYDAAYLNAVAVDSSYVYWVAGANGADGAIMRAPIGGGSAPVAIYSGLQLPQGVVSDGTNVYWVEWGTFDTSTGRANNDGSVWQGSTDGTAARIQLGSSQPAPSGIAVDASHVYWTNLGPLGGLNLPAPLSGSVMMAPIGGGSLTTIADHQAVPVCIIVAGSTVYWSQYGLNVPGWIMSAPAGGGAVVPLASGLYDPAALAVWNGTIYWTNANSSPHDGYIMSLRPLP
jgi:sugar lactone lactonase YvrE